jgi:two-component system, OmpR family, KDP operon response regulator KdpE
VDANPDQTPAGCRILIADGDAPAVAQLVSALQQEGYVAITAGDGSAALRALFAHHPHLVALSLALPGMDAWTVLQRIHEVTDIPVLIVSTKRAVGYRVRAFELGAHDYITKPYHLQEVVLRVKAALQHSTALSDNAFAAYDDGILRIDGWKRDVLVNGQRLSVTPRELRLLLFLVHQPGRLVPYTDLVAKLPWLAGEDRESALRSLLHRLRHKLDQAAPGSNFILTQRSLGVRLNVK